MSLLEFQKAILAIDTKDLVSWAYPCSIYTCSHRTRHQGTACTHCSDILNKETLENI